MGHSCKRDSAPGFFFVLATLARTVFFAGFLERPLVLAFFWGFITGEWFPCLILAVFFELLWLDLFHIGSFIPPFGALPFLLFLSIYPLVDWSLLSFLASLLLMVPAGYASAWVEQKIRTQMVDVNEALMQASAQPEPIDTIIRQCVVTSLGRQSGAALLIFAAAFGVYCPTIILIAHSVPLDSLICGGAIAPLAAQSVIPPELCLILIPSALGGAMALRLKKAGIIFAVMAILLWVCGVVAQHTTAYWM